MVARRTLAMIRPTRLHATLVGTSLVAVWVLIAFVRAFGASAGVDEQAAALRSENAALQARLDAGRAELDAAADEPYVSIQARAYGMGEPGERVFTVRTTGPAPQVPLLGEDPDARPPTPIEDWLDLLFGD